ncbi:MAG: hypothetical protein ACUVTH_09090 [Thermogutta sp.]
MKVQVVYRLELSGRLFPILKIKPNVWAGWEKWWKIWRYWDESVNRTGLD